ncbi:hypothetical protein PBI_SCTP2_501 [Salicola phage SCTP-2]|nr:hypothetical protein PBI_SCTP2_501 [Salicola phage SCTP-2]
MITANSDVAYKDPTLRARMEYNMDLYGWYADIDGRYRRSDRLKEGDMVTIIDGSESILTFVKYIDWKNRMIFRGWQPTIINGSYVSKGIPIWVPFTRIKHKGERVDRPETSDEKIHRLESYLTLKGLE